jgi:hypothetical protein
MSDSDTRAAAKPERRRGSRRGPHFHLTVISIGITLIVILSAAQWIGMKLGQQNATRMGAIFAIGVVSFLGVLSLGHEGPRYRPFEASEVRTAIATAFSMVFFAAVGIFLFSTNTVGEFGQTLMSNLTSLFGVVIGFYFASSAVVEYGKIRAGKTGDQAPSETPPAPARSTGALEAKIAELEATVSRLVAASTTASPSPTVDGHDTPPAITEPSSRVSATND